jgi:hypothetical protein
MSDPRERLLDALVDEVWDWCESADDEGGIRARLDRVLTESGCVVLSREDVEPVGALILAHRKASMSLQSALLANGRRGASATAVEDVNRTGEAMARIERDLRAALATGSRE